MRLKGPYYNVIYHSAPTLEMALSVAFWFLCLQL